MTLYLAESRDFIQKTVKVQGRNGLVIVLQIQSWLNIRPVVVQYWCIPLTVKIIAED